MIIDYLVPKMYTKFDLEATRSAGGGMQPNINARKTALESRYKVNLVSEIDTLKSEFCLVECLWFAQEWKKDVSPEKLATTYAERIDAFCKTKSTKVVVCSELQIARLHWWVRAKIKHFPAGLVVNDRCLWDITVALDITPIGYLCDAIDPYLFKPGKKELSVIALGGLKHIKNPYLIFEVFRKLEGTGIKRIFIGSAGIWSNEKRPEDIRLEKEIKACTDLWIPNASYIDTAYHLSSGAIAINDTWHDISSRSNQEQLMSGLVSIGGKHPLFENRPGIHGLETADDFIAAIQVLTDNYTQIPYKACQKSRDWALKHVSTDMFLQQFDQILRSVYL